MIHEINQVFFQNFFDIRIYYFKNIILKIYYFKYYFKNIYYTLSYIF